MKKILISLGIIGVAAVAVVGATGAYFSDVETSEGNTLTAGTLNLQVAKFAADGYVDPLTTALVDLDDLKPSITQYEYKKLKVGDNPGNVYMHIKNVVGTPGEQTEPEETEETVYPARAGWTLDTYAEYDLKIDLNGDDDYTDSNETIIEMGVSTIEEVTSCWIPLGSLTAGIDYKVEQSFHLKPTVTNWAQGDVLTFTEEFMLLQLNDPFDPTVDSPTGSTNVWNPGTHKCVTPG